MLGDNDALGVADRILGHHRHARAQQLARRRIAHPAQGVHAQALGLGPVGRGGAVQLGPEGVDHGVRRTLGRIPARIEGLGEGGDGGRVQGGRAQGHHAADLNILEVGWHGSPNRRGGFVDEVKRL